MLAKKSFLSLFSIQRDNTGKLFLSSFGEFGKICDLWYLVWPHAKIYCCLWAASSLNGTAEVSDESDAWEIWEWGVGIGHITSGVCSANQDVKHLFCSLQYICKGMVWICVLQCSSGPFLIVIKQMMLWALRLEKYWPSTALPALFGFFCLLIFVAQWIKDNFRLCKLLEYREKTK